MTVPRPRSAQCWPATRAPGRLRKLRHDSRQGTRERQPGLAAPLTCQSRRPPFQPPPGGSGRGPIASAARAAKTGLADEAFRPRSPRQTSGRSGEMPGEDGAQPEWANGGRDRRTGGDRGPANGAPNARHAAALIAARYPAAVGAPPRAIGSFPPTQRRYKSLPAPRAHRPDVSGARNWMLSNRPAEPPSKPNARWRLSVRSPRLEPSPMRQVTISRPARRYGSGKKQAAARDIRSSPPPIIPRHPCVVA